MITSVAINRFSFFSTSLLLAQFAIGASTQAAESGFQAQAINWAQPPVSCVEEVVPALPDRACLDLSKLDDPNKDLPKDLPAAEAKYWLAHPQPLGYCRAVETLKREAAHPGTFKSGTLETAWMRSLAPQHSADKVAAIYEASRTRHLPAQVLAGALDQESLYTELGIYEDGGNFSCGVGQVNINEWCRWANDETSAGKKKIGWPSAAVDCGSFNPELLRPFYKIALTRLNGEPEYRLLKAHFSGITLADVVDGFPSGSPAVQAQRYQLAESFINFCSEARPGIAAKAHELSVLYRNFVPAGMKQIDRYRQGETYQRKCSDQGDQTQYPLNQAWLLAVGAYNAGPRAVDALAYYNNWSPDDLKQPSTFAEMTVVDMVKAFYWSGFYDKVTDKITIRTLGGQLASWIWMKPCVLQRHIARVVQWVTLPDAPVLVDSLEGRYKCALSVFDSSGQLMSSAVPPFRQVSSGQKDN